ncbi:hypothetical protein B296_00021023 [Ensete ventricosum]|uniref:Uncharacterized protein n=1 Tax=Ensete ventricosum TaxID=4639 RepID=A0A426Y245_ENSVE|nr:hypothetical protein B296_00021023 [Ensete ventricosum]
MALLDRVHDASRLMTIMDHRATNFQQEIEELKSGSGPKQVAAVEQQAIAIEQRVTDLQADNEKLMAQLVKATHRLELFNKELNDAWVDLSDTQRQLK